MYYRNYLPKILTLLSLSIFLLSACTPSGKENSNEKQRIEYQKLKDVTSIPIGTAVHTRRLFQDSMLMEIQKQNFNSITASNEMKMYNIAPEKGIYNFKEADQLLEYAEKNNQRLFGHNLIWHSSTPDWVKEMAMSSPDSLEVFMKEYIQTYVRRYKGKVDGWDVVNEGMNTFGGGYRETMWYQALGKDYIARAFTYTHEADPDAVLFYNDFNIERDTAKLHSTLRMIEDLKQQGIPISGLGFQMHIRMDIPDSLIAYSLQKGAETGLQIHLSEVDIIFNRHNDEKGGGEQLYEELTDEMKKAQAEKYRNLASMYRSIVPEDQQYGITFWGFNDRDTWINGFFGLNDWPTIFDDNLKPKPAYEGFIKGLTEEPDSRFKSEDSSQKLR